jgi:hypothetical protein
MGRYALIEEATHLVTGVVMWDGTVESGWAPPEGFLAIELPEDSTVGFGWSYVNGVFVAPPEPEVPPPTYAEILAAQSSKLVGFKQLAEAQKAALTKRIAILQDSMDYVGVEGMEEFAATPEEQAEFVLRKAQYTRWKNYAILLGRVTTQAGWPTTVTWPVQPSDGMDLTVSSLAPPTA